MSQRKRLKMDIPARDKLDIVSLPEVVKDNICKYLDVSSLMNLRLTCKNLKISNSKQLQTVLESKVPWNSFVLNFKSLEVQTYLHEFSERYGRFMRKLRITTLGGHEKTVHLLTKCPQLNELDIQTVNHCDEEDWEQNDEEDWDQETIEYVHDPLPEWDNKDSRDILIHPILDYTQSRKKPNIPQVKRINVKDIPFFEWRTLKDLMHVCHENRIRLLGIQSCQFSFIINEIPDLNPLTDYIDVVQSAQLDFINREFPLSLLDNLSELKVCINPVNPALELRENSNLAWPRLRHLRVQFMYSVNNKHGQLFIKKLFKEYKRNTVQRLQLDWHLHEICRTISAMDLIHNFQNVRELEISAWNTAVDSDFCLLWTNLMHLEKLIIKDCKLITNKAFVGNFNLRDDRNIYHRPLNRLKKLKSLTIWDISGKVDEVAMMGSFKWIELHYFEFESRTIAEIREEVYRSMMIGPFGKSVEYFIAPEPFSQSKFFSKRALMQGFKNLKRRASW